MKINKRIPIYLLFIFAILLFEGCNPKKTEYTNASKHVDSIISSLIKQKHIVGISLAVVKNGKVVKNTCWGQKNEGGEDINDHTAFQLASTTKIFTGTAFMSLVQNGKLSPVDTVGKFLKDIPDKWKGVQLKRLLSHTSGLPNMLNPYTGEYIADSPERAYNIALNKDTIFAPGKAWMYNQVGYVLIKKIIEKVSHKSLEDFMKKQIFIPNSMELTTFDSTAISEYISPNFELVDSIVKPMNYHFSEFIQTAGGLYSSTIDLIKFANIISEDKFMNKLNKQKLWEPVEYESDKGPKYGLGWYITDIDGFKAVGHTGGRKTLFMHIPEKKLSIIILSNTQGTDPHIWWKKIAKEYIN